MKRGFGTAVAIIVAMTACSEPIYLEAVKARYGKGSCQTCHVSPPKRNAFGVAVERALRQSGKAKVDSVLLAGLEDGDEDADGRLNGDELASGGFPGAGDSQPETDAPLIPSHAFHPIFVHFPIALFLFGSVLDVVGKRRGDSALGNVASWNLVTGAVLGVPTIAAGFAAYFLKGFAFEGIPLFHLVFGVLAALSMALVAAKKAKGRDRGVAYWTAVILANVLVIIAGHLGATLVGH